MCNQTYTMDEGDVEQSNFFAVKSAFLNYQRHSVAEIDRVQPCYGSLEARFKELLPEVDRQFAAMKRCVAENYDFVCNLAEVDQHTLFLNQNEVHDGASPAQQIAPSEGDMQRVRGVLQHLVRDWSADGADERDQCYTPLLTELEATFPRHEVNRGSIRVLVPGAGLGRLAYEIRQRGFCVQGNELSLYMLMASDFVFNRCPTPGQFRVYPYLHQMSSLMSRSDVLREVSLPDVSPLVGTEGSGGGDLSMVAGDFTEIYGEAGHRERWNAVVTCYFLDTGKNIFEYIETICHTLPTGGHWLNFGPLLFQRTRAGNPSVVLSMEELRHVVTSFGFDIVREDLHTAAYTGNPRALVSTTQNNFFFHAVKTGRPRTADEAVRRASNNTRRPVPEEVMPENTTNLS